MRKNPAPRARDFYDIYVVIEQTELDVAGDSFCTLIRSMFEAKEVPVGLLGSIGEYREFHREDWPAVQDSVRGLLESFDHYFDAVVAESNRLLHALGEV